MSFCNNEGKKCQSQRNFFLKVNKKSHPKLTGNLLANCFTIDDDVVVVS